MTLLSTGWITIRCCHETTGCIDDSTGKAIKITSVDFVIITESYVSGRPLAAVRMGVAKRPIIYLVVHIQLGTLMNHEKSIFLEPSYLKNESVSIHNLFQGTLHRRCAYLALLRLIPNSLPYMQDTNIINISNDFWTVCKCSMCVNG